MTSPRTITNTLQLAASKALQSSLGGVDAFAALEPSDWTVKSSTEQYKVPSVVCSAMDAQEAGFTSNFTCTLGITVLSLIHEDDVDNLHDARCAYVEAWCQDVARMSADIEASDEQITFMGHGPLSVGETDIQDDEVLVTTFVMVCGVTHLKTEPVILRHPEARTLTEEGPVTLEVEASNVESYRWQVWDGSGFIDMPSETSNTLSITAKISESGFYRAVVTSRHGVEKASNVVYVAALDFVSTSGPEALLVEGSGVFVADAPNATDYLWLESTDGINWTEVAGGDTNTLTWASPTIGTRYLKCRAWVESDSLPVPGATAEEAEVFSDVFAVEVLSPWPAFTTQPEADPAFVGDVVTLTAIADRAGAYQWFKLTPGGPVPVSGGTNVDLVVTVIDGVNSYYVQFTPELGETVNSNTVTIPVLSPDGPQTRWRLLFTSGDGTPASQWDGIRDLVAYDDADFGDPAPYAQDGSILPQPEAFYASSEYPGREAGHAFDVDPNTYWTPSPNGWIGNNFITNGDWIQWEYASPVEVKAIALDAYAYKGLSGTPLTFELQTSPDGSTWFTRGSGEIANRSDGARLISLETFKTASSGVAAAANYVGTESAEDSDVWVGIRGERGHLIARGVEPAPYPIHTTEVTLPESLRSIKISPSATLGSWEATDDSDWEALAATKLERADGNPLQSISRCRGVASIEFDLDSAATVTLALWTELASPFTVRVFDADTGVELLAQSILPYVGIGPYSKHFETFQLQGRVRIEFPEADPSGLINLAGIFFDPVSALVITSQPVDTAASAGDSVSLSVEATGAETYQWQFASASPSTIEVTSLALDNGDGGLRWFDDVSKRVAFGSATGSSLAGASSIRYVAEFYVSDLPGQYPIVFAQNMGVDITTGPSIFFNGPDLWLVARSTGPDPLLGINTPLGDGFHTVDCEFDFASGQIRATVNGGAEMVESVAWASSTFQPDLGATAYAGCNQVDNPLNGAVKSLKIYRDGVLVHEYSDDTDWVDQVGSADGTIQGSPSDISTVAENAWTDIVDGGGISGAQTPSLSFSELSISDELQYRCLVSSSLLGETLTSDAARITVLEYAVGDWASWDGSSDVAPQQVDTGRASFAVMSEDRVLTSRQGSTAELKLWSVDAAGTLSLLDTLSLSLGSWPGVGIGGPERIDDNTAVFQGEDCDSVFVYTAGDTLSASATYGFGTSGDGNVSYMDAALGSGGYLITSPPEAFGGSNLHQVNYRRFSSIDPATPEGGYVDLPYLYDDGIYPTPFASTAPGRAIFVHGNFVRTVREASLGTLEYGPATQLPNLPSDGSHVIKEICPIAVDMYLVVASSRISGPNPTYAYVVQDSSARPRILDLTADGDLTYTDFVLPRTIVYKTENGYVAIFRAGDRDDNTRSFDRITIGFNGAITSTEKAVAGTVPEGSPPSTTNIPSTSASHLSKGLRSTALSGARFITDTFDSSGGPYSLIIHNAPTP